MTKPPLFTIIPPGSSWLRSNVPNARREGQPNRDAGEGFRRPPGVPPADWCRTSGWGCNGSTTGSGPVSRGSNPCAPAFGRAAIVLVTAPSPGGPNSTIARPYRTAPGLSDLALQVVLAARSHVGVIPSISSPHTRSSDRIGRSLRVTQVPLAPVGRQEGSRTGLDRRSDPIVREVATPRHGDQLSVQEAIDHPRIDVRGSADRRGVAERRRHLLDDRGHHALREGDRRQPLLLRASIAAVSTVACHVRKSFDEISSAARSFR